MTRGRGKKKWAGKKCCENKLYRMIKYACTRQRLLSNLSFGAINSRTENFWGGGGG